MNTADIQRICDAAASVGFSAMLGGNSLALTGDLDGGDRKVSVRISFSDLALIDAPRFTVVDCDCLPRPVVPHIDEDGDICVVQRSLYVLDRYHVAEQLLGLIDRARTILSDAVKPSADAEIARELPRYWSTKAHTINGPTPPISFVSTQCQLSFLATQARPNTLSALLAWASAWDPKLAAGIMSAFARQGANDPIIAIDAPNGILLAQLRVSVRGTAFVKSLSRAKGWERYLAGPQAGNLEITRRVGQKVDVDTILDANGAPLAGKQILVVGCGAIGGYLARMLVQLGAGFKGGRLVLVDDDVLDSPNVRRHVLGFDAVGQPKASGLGKLLSREFPGVKITQRQARIESMPYSLPGFELIIDATGEQAVSEWLNDWAIERRRLEANVPTLLHGWVAGLGAAAQSFISTERGFACMRCLQPDHAKPGRFDPLREAPPEPVDACGAPVSMPYGPQAPITAAALIAQHSADWARGSPHHLLRTTRIDWKTTVKRDPVSPPPAPGCPACGSQ